MAPFHAYIFKLSAERSADSWRREYILLFPCSLPNYCHAGASRKVVQEADIYFRGWAKPVDLFEAAGCVGRRRLRDVLNAK